MERVTVPLTQAISCRYSRSLPVLAILDIPLHVTIWGIASALLAWAMSRSSLSYLEEDILTAYLQSGTGVLALAMTLPLDWLRKARLAAERNLAGLPTGLHLLKLGRITEWFGYATWLPWLAVTLLACFYVLKASLWTTSIQDTRTACIWFPVAVLGLKISAASTDVGRRLQSLPVVCPEGIDWTLTTGLLLRGFQDEQVDIGQTKKNRVLAEVLVRSGTSRELMLISPSQQWLAIARPGEQLVTPGVQRVALPNEGWQDWVLRAMDRSAVIAIFLAQSDGLKWEYQQIIETKSLEKLRVIVLPDDSPKQREAFFSFLTELRPDIATPSIPRFNTEIQICEWRGSTCSAYPVDLGKGIRSSFIRIGVGQATNWLD